MEIFMPNVPFFFNNREAQLHKALAPHCNSVNILAFRVQVFRSKGKGVLCGNLTVPTCEAGERFLSCFGQTPQGRKAPAQVSISGQRICFKRSNRGADIYVVRSLMKEQEDLTRKKLQPQLQLTISKALQKKFKIDRLECGVWSTEPEGSTHVFDCYYSVEIDGTLRFGGKEAIAKFNVPQSGDDSGIDDMLRTAIAMIGGMSLDGPPKKLLVMRYMEIESIVVFAQDTESVAFTLQAAPRFYLEMARSDEFVQGPGADTRRRLSSLDPEHACFAPFAFVYRFRFKSVRDADLVLLLDGRRGMPPIIKKYTKVCAAKGRFEWSFQKLLERLQSDFSGPEKFNVAFRLQALWANGYLPPISVLGLLPRVYQIVADVGYAQAAEILEDFMRNLDSNSPTYGADFLSHKPLIAALDAAARQAPRRLSPIARNVLKAQEARMASVNHVTVTPAGCYFYGPRSEPQNRVLRKYPDHHEYFIRVMFCEEDGDQLQFQYKVDQGPIYNGQFRRYLEKGLVIAGRKFEFLGFSSSSLRSQSCWFMAPFWFKGKELDCAKVTAGLGNFSGIRCPGRCAARIGQAFSDTVGSIHVPLENESVMEDVMRNNRNFSDGVGTISQQMLERIWRESDVLSRTKPTVFQIRFTGAKGVVSLDTRLEGDKFCLRPSMIKFEGSNDRNIEICSSPDCLPLFLNRPLIKVLEDIGVVESTFTRLQSDAIAELRKSTKSAAHAASFLTRRRIGAPAIRLPWVIEALHNIGLNFRDDNFLEQTFELALTTSLRDLKHRARIPVPEGMTLIGVMDETGFLEEGEIYCAVSGTSNASKMSTSRLVLITRSPCHHPGDVQKARSIGINELPANSPLRALRNCVVFSQKGERDLPSMLSGGDLDGDLYNIIYDSRFNVIRTYSPAQYPMVTPKDLGRPVETADIIKFFLEFMQNDLIGIISTKHLTIADQESEGVHHRNCLKLAEMASAAVDFPKTGERVNRSEFPRCSPSKPDFMAPGPRILVQKTLSSEIDSDAAASDSENEDQPTLYYNSPKVLGVLYRAIDETAFLKEVQGEVQRERLQRNVNEGSVIRGVWNYFCREIPSIYQWEEYIADAEALKDIYEENVRGLMISYSDTPWKHQLREVEVFLGCIVGRERQTHKQRESSVCMKEQFDRLVASIVESMRGDNSREQVLGWGMASLSLCLPEKTWVDLDALKSFAWIAVSVLLTEVDKMQKERKERISRRGRSNGSGVPLR